jgi:hypothetical protein
MSPEPPDGADPLDAIDAFDLLDAPDAPAAFAPRDAPDLRQLPRHQWAEALARVTHFARCRAAQAFGEGPDFDHAMQLVADLFMEHGDRPRRPEVRRATPELPVPRTIGPPDSRGIQVNVRLRPLHHARLVEAAELVGMSPTALARTFMVDGTRRLLAQRDRDIGPP